MKRTIKGTHSRYSSWAEQVTKLDNNDDVDEDVERYSFSQKNQDHMQKTSFYFTFYSLLYPLGFEYKAVMHFFSLTFFEDEKAEINLFKKYR